MLRVSTMPSMVSRCKRRSFRPLGGAPTPGLPPRRFCHLRGVSALLRTHGHVAIPSAMTIKTNNQRSRAGKELRVGAHLRRLDARGLGRSARENFELLNGARVVKSDARFVGRITT